MCFYCSGPFQSWLATRTRSWSSRCMTRWAQRPSATSSTKVQPPRHRAPLTLSRDLMCKSEWWLIFGDFAFPASISTVICDVPEKAQLILDCIGGKTRSVKRIVIMDAFDGELVTRGQQCGVDVVSLKEIEVRYLKNKFFFYIDFTVSFSQVLDVPTWKFGRCVSWACVFSSLCAMFVTGIW